MSGLDELKATSEEIAEYAALRDSPEVRRYLVLYEIVSMHLKIEQSEKYGLLKRKHLDAVYKKIEEI